MATFYFDFQDDGELLPDREGLDFESFGEAKRQAIRALTEITQETLPKHNHHVFAVSIRNADARTLLRASIVFDIDVDQA
jgi:hypothetical protein